MKGRHRWIVFHGWLTLCANCRMARLRKSAVSMKRANGPCKSSWAT